MYINNNLVTSTYSLGSLFLLSRYKFIKILKEDAKINNKILFWGFMRIMKVAINAEKMYFFVLFAMSLPSLLA